MFTEVLSAQAMNRAVLARQLLLERSNLSTSEALDQIAGIQNQYAPNGYIGLWSRLAEFKREPLTTALEKRELVQGTTLRGTIHLVTPEFFQLSNEAVREERAAWWFRAARRDDQEAKRVVAKQIAQALAQGPRKRAALMKDLGIDTASWNGATAFLDLIRVPPSGTWENRRADLYDLFAAPSIDPAAARREMVDRYLRAFGPAGGKDIAAFLALNLNGLMPLLAGYRTFLSEDGSELFDVEDGLLPDPNTPAPPRFLPPWDANLLVHARRTGILPEEYRPLIFNTKMPQSVPTFMIDGRVAGTWALDANDLRLSPFRKLDRRSASELEDEAEKLRAFIA
ncbi:MAG: winged helix DNA-binding domain-containing protein [Actinobacteria bacterium]|nr:winged helix DNA-binding domain-containing protein [Actinomycetota bacterium]